MAAWIWSTCRRGAGLCIAISLLAACAGHRPPPPSTDVDEAGFRDAVRVLASDEFAGRRPGTPGEEKTVAYLVDQFRRLGLKPGNGDSFLQQVPLVEVTAGEARLSLRGHGATSRLSVGRDLVLWTERTAPEAVLRQSELEFVGYGIVAPEFGWDDYAATDVRGKTVVVLVGDPGIGSKDPKAFKGTAGTAYGRWAYKVDEASRHGAAGVLLIHDPAVLGYGWNAVVNARSAPQLELATPDAVDRPVIEGWLSAAAGRALFAGAGLDFGAIVTAAAHPGFKPPPLGLTMDAEIHATVRRLTSPNVIAVLPGASHKREYVIYSAHWDGLGRQSADEGGALRNGAVDNASGVAGLLMLAQSFVRTQPAAERSIVFIAFTAAEQGLLGSAYYVGNPLLPLKDTVAVLNLDTLHIGGPTRDVVVFGQGNSELDEYLREAAQLQGREIHPDPHPEWGSNYASDQYSFAAAGIPGLYAKAGSDDSARGPTWGQARLDDYLANRYRQPDDRYSADWDVRGTLDDLRLYYEVGNRLARSRHFPRWYPDSEFRVSRHRARDAAPP